MAELTVDQKAELLERFNNKTLTVEDKTLLLEARKATEPKPGILEGVAKRFQEPVDLKNIGGTDEDLKRMVGAATGSIGAVSGGAIAGRALKAGAGLAKAGGSKLAEIVGKNAIKAVAGGATGSALYNIIKSAISGKDK